MQNIFALHSLKNWLSQNKKSSLITFLSFLGITALLALKDTEIIGEPYLWAEDGPIFLPDAIKLGKKSLFKPYAGYLHLLSRLCAWISVKISMLSANGIQLAPLFMQLFALCTMGFCTAYFCKDSFSWLVEKKSQRFFVCACLALFTNRNCAEVFYTITNVQWWIGFLPFLMGLNMLHSRDFAISKFEFVILMLIGFSTTLGAITVFLFITCFLYKFFSKKQIKVKDVVLCIIIAMPTFIQFLVNHKTSQNESASILLAIPKAFLVLIGNVPFFFVFDIFDKSVFAIVSLSIIGFCIWTVLFLGMEKSRREVFILAIVFIFLNCVLINLRKFDIGGIFFIRCRYTFIPYLAFVFLLGIEVVRRIVLFAKTKKIIACIALLFSGFFWFRVREDLSFIDIFKQSSSLYYTNGQGSGNIMVKIAPNFGSPEKWTYCFPFTLEDKVETQNFQYNIDSVQECGLGSFFLHGWCIDKENKSSPLTVLGYDNNGNYYAAKMIPSPDVRDAFSKGEKCKTSRFVLWLPSSARTQDGIVHLIGFSKDKKLFWRFDYAIKK